MITFEDIRKNAAVSTYIQAADDVMNAMKFTEHGFAHAGIASNTASHILSALGSDDRTCELARIAGHMHDIGNAVNRENHAQSGGVMAFEILTRLGMEPRETALIVTAIGHHDEGSGGPVHPISAALIIADKSDVRRSRVRDKADIAIDIHDRVNFAVTGSELRVLAEEKRICLSLQIDTRICPVMEYFEIFLSRMLLCRKAAEYLGCRFTLEINGTKLL